MRTFNFYIIPMSKETFRKFLRGAMIYSSPERYSVSVLILVLSSFLAGDIISQMLSIYPPFIFLPFAMTTYVFMVTYPIIKMKSRKVNIDLKLPHAITYMQSFCDVLPLYEIFKLIYREREIYGEVSEEFGFIVRDVELFGEDLVTAMRSLMETTPSENLREFLEGLIMAFDSGGNIKEYMQTKVEHFREIARKQFEMNLKTLEILSEIYVVLFVAFPIFLIVMIFAMELTGGSIGYEYYLYLYVFLPLGSILLILIIDTVNVKEDLSVTKIVRKNLRYPREIISRNLKHEIKLNEKLPLTRKIAESVRRNYYNALYFSGITVTFFLFLYYGNILKLKFFESFLAATLIAAIIPLLVAFEYRARLVRKVEREIPDLLREILNLKDVGITLLDIVRILKDSKIGILSRELRFVYAETEWGETVIDALIELVNRVGTAGIRRVISLLVDASQATENLREILLRTIEDFEFGLKLKTERFISGFSYLFITYLSFYIFLYTVYSLNTSFISGFSKIGTVSAPNLDLMYRISILLATFSGIIAGQMEKGHILYGLKHICIFLLSSIILFEFVLGGG